MAVMALRMGLRRPSPAGGKTAQRRPAGKLRAVPRGADTARNRLGREYCQPMAVCLQASVLRNG